MRKYKTLPRVCGSIARTLLGLTFIFSGFVKAVDPLGTTYKIEDYLNAFGGFFTTFLPLAEAVSYCMIAFEFILGILLLCNIATKATSWLSLLFMLIMTPITLYLAITNPITDCGCFGEAVHLTNWQTFWKNVILLALVITLLCTQKHIPQTFLAWVEWLIFGLAVITISVIMLVARLTLPAIDFRPYKIGNNLAELMEVPEDAPRDEYDITLVYEKDGEQQVFTLEDYPRGDSTWIFVEQRSTLIKKGYEAPIHDFELISEDFDDLTYDILESDEPVTLIIMYDLAKTDRRQALKLNALYQRAEAEGRAFYAITGSGTTEIEAFQEEMNAEYPFLTCDPVTLKTIVRANPGAIVLQNGVVIDKYNLRQRK